MDRFVVFADILNKINRTNGKVTFFLRVFPKHIWRLVAINLHLDSELLLTTDLSSN